KPLESRFYALDGIKRIKTTITNGVAFIFVEYVYGENYEGKYQELIRELSAAKGELPDNIYSAEVKKVDPTTVSVIQTALISENTSTATMKRLADDLKSRLEKVKALKDIEISGLPDQLIRVDLNLSRLANLKIPMDQVVQAMQSENQNIPGGAVVAGGKSFSVTTSGDYKSIEQIKNTVISSAEGRNILLNDVADVYPTFGQPTHITRLNGYHAVLVNAAQKGGMNISETQATYNQVFEEFRQTLPANVDFIVNFDQADQVNSRISGLAIDFVIAISLVLFTLLPLGTRASLVVMIAIPLSLGLGLITLNIIGYSLNQLSIVGFVVALGLVVDDSIVVVENIERWMRDGYTRLEAAIKGTHQIALAVVGCTVTLVIAFLPLMFMPEMAGDFIRSMPTAVIASVVGSMFIALLVVPFLSSKLLKPHASQEGNAILRVLKKIIHSTYAVWLDKALKHPARTAIIAFGIFLASLALIPVVGFSLFPASEKPQFMIHIAAPLQGSLQTTDSITRKIEAELHQIEDIKFFTSNVGKGNPTIYYNMSQASENVGYADIFVQLYDDVKAKEKELLIEDLRQKWTNYLGAKIEVKNFEQGVPVISPVEVRLFGDDLDTLQRLAADVEELLKNTPGNVYINNPLKNKKTDLRVFVNREKAVALGVPTVRLDRTVRIPVYGYEGGIHTESKVDNNEYSIVATVPRLNRSDMTVFAGIFVNNVEGTAIPLAQLATLAFESSPPNIYHQDKNRMVSVN